MSTELFTPPRLRKWVAELIAVTVVSVGRFLRSGSLSASENRTQWAAMAGSTSGVVLGTMVLRITSGLATASTGADVGLLV